MKREQIRAPASCRQASCLKPACLHREEVRMQMLKEGVCEAGDAAYTRPISSHIRGRQRRICETNGLVYTKQSAPNMRVLTTARQVSDEDTGGRDNPFIINQINDYECKV